jgi:hypothetical protein
MTRNWLAGCAAGAAVLLWWRAQAPRPEVTRAAEPEQATVLIRFGLKETQPRRWDGNLRVEGGQALSLEGWQFAAGDEILPGNSWRCATRQESYWHAPWERSLYPTKNLDKMTAKGLVLRTTATARVALQTPHGTFEFAPADITWTEPREFAGGDVVVSRAPGAARLTSEAASEDYPALWEAADGKIWLAYQSYERGGDRLWVRRGLDVPAEPLTEAGQDLFRPAMAGGWVVWAQLRNGDWDLYGRRFDGRRWTAPERLTTAVGPDIFHNMAGGPGGRAYLAWQSFRGGQSDIYLRVWDGRRWGPEVRVSEDRANDWEPAVAAAPGGRVTVVWDTYGRGNYDVVMRHYQDGKLLPVETVAASDAFESRPAAVYDKRGLLWLAWDEGDADWGKDYALGIKDAGMGLLMRRQVRVAVYEGGQFGEYPGLAESIPEAERQIFQRPALALDGNGNPWVLLRFRTNTPRRTGGGEEAGGGFRSMWRLGASSFQRGAWTKLIEFPEGYGRQDAPTAVTVRKDGAIQVVWNSDGRTFGRPRPNNQDLWSATLAAGPAGPAVQTRPLVPAAEKAANPHPNEAADVARLREYRAEAGGKTYRIVRGDMHRHTDLSWDGNRDGTLFDCYRYSLDAAAFDYVGTADHQAGETEYTWWVAQKAVRLFTAPGRFAPLYGYERSLSYPNGHRNIMSARAGVPVFPIPEAERKGQEGAAKLFEHLRTAGGISMPHTSATGAGTDFRDADAAVEPLVEIYQGYRHNYEHAGAPRAEPKVPRPAGLIWNAWAKGLKIGVQSSSDHVSTHTSYAALYVTELTREAILEAIRARRSYAATDNILVDFRMNGRLIGEAFQSAETPRLWARVAGTGPIRSVEVIRNNTYIHSQAGSGPSLELNYVDNQPPAGESYYYIRVEQADGQLAWSSPIWVRR